LTNHAAATIIFDLGQVILPFDMHPACEKIGELCGTEGSEVMRRIYRSNLERWFEAGLLDGAQFTELVTRQFGLDIDEVWLHNVWTDIFWENVEVTTLIHRLKNHHPLIILSNTNTWHWEAVHKKFAIVREIPNRVLSFEEGVLKPHPAIYRAALEKADREHPVVFIDDIESNVDGARMLGITGIHFQSATQLEADLRALGCEFD
jgi:HAD superfamily hydrolase (TIGR01509 family)